MQTENVGDELNIKRRREFLLLPISFKETETRGGGGGKAIENGKDYYFGCGGDGLVLLTMMTVAVVLNYVSESLRKRE